MGNGGFINSASSDITFAQVHSAIGEKEGLLKAASPEEIMNIHEMIGEGNDPDIGE